MPLDPNIPLQVRPVQIPDAVGAYARALQLRSMLQQEKLGQMQLEAAQRAQADEDAARELFSRTPDPTPAEVFGAVGPTRGSAILKSMAEQRKASLEEQMSTLKLRGAQSERLGQLTGAVLAAPAEQRQAAYEQALTQAVEEGLIPQAALGQIPKQFDEGLLRRFQTQAMSAKEQYEAQLKAIQDRRAAEKHEAELPGIKASSEAKQREDAAAQLAAAGSAEEYARIWGALPAAVARKFPAPEEWDPQTTPATVRQRGMTPAQQEAAARPTGDLREFREVFLPGYYEEKGITQPNARTELEAWKEYRKEKAARQPVPGRDVPYPADVEAQRKRMARAQINGLTAQQTSQVNSLARKFDDHPLVKHFNETSNKFETVRQIVDAGLGGPGDLAVVFEFMKGLDPTSVVRESEYRSAAASGNIFKGAMARFNGYFKPEGGFLPEEVKRGFLSALEAKLATTGRQVQGLYKDYARRIDKITGQPGTGAEYLTDYTALMGIQDAERGGEDLTNVSTDELFRRLTNAK